MVPTLQMSLMGLSEGSVSAGTPRLRGLQVDARGGASSVKYSLTPVMIDGVLTRLTTQAYQVGTCIRIKKADNIYVLGLESNEVIRHLVVLMKMPPEEEGAMKAEDACRQDRYIS